MVLEMARLSRARSMVLEMARLSRARLMSLEGARLLRVCPALSLFARMKTV
jgi:hypothetical protein